MTKLSLILLLFIQGCNTKELAREAPGLLEEGLPFKVLPLKESVPLPSKIGPSIKNVKVIFHFFIGSHGENLGINIAYLSFYDFDGNQIFREIMPVMKIAAKSQYPPKIQHYYDYLIDFAGKSKIIRTDESEDGKTYLYRLPLLIE